MDFLYKIAILNKNWNFCRESKFRLKNEILIKNGFFVEHLNFGRKYKYWPKIYIFIKNGNVGRKSKFWSKMQILVENRLKINNVEKYSRQSSQNRMTIKNNKNCQIRSFEKNNHIPQSFIFVVIFRKWRHKKYFPVCGTDLYDSL